MASLRVQDLPFVQSISPAFQFINFGGYLNKRRPSNTLHNTGNWWFGIVTHKHNVAYLRVLRVVSA